MTHVCSYTLKPRLWEKFTVKKNVWSVENINYKMLFTDVSPGSHKITNADCQVKGATPEDVQQRLYS